MKIKYNHGTTLTDASRPADPLSNRPFETHVQVPKAQATAMAQTGAFCLCALSLLPSAWAIRRYALPAWSIALVAVMVLVVSYLVLDVVLTWLFLLQHRGLIIPRGEAFPDPEPASRLGPLRVRRGRFVLGDERERFDADLWEFAQGVFPRGTIDSQSPPWASRAWVGKTMESGTKVNRAYFARLMEELTECRAILDRKPGHPGTWNTKVKSLRQLADVLGFDTEQED